MDYSDSLDGVTEADLEPFFEGWKAKPTIERRMSILRGSHRVIVARDGERLVGFITAISDGVLSAYIPLLEVLPAYRHSGIGTELTRRMVESLGDMYMIDVVCEVDLAGFYERLGMTRLVGMAIRNREALYRR